MTANSTLNQPLAPNTYPLQHWLQRGLRGSAWNCNALHIRRIMSWPRIVYKAGWGLTFLLTKYGRLNVEYGRLGERNWCSAATVERRVRQRSLGYDGEGRKRTSNLCPLRMELTTDDGSCNDLWRKWSLTYCCLREGMTIRLMVFVQRPFLKECSFTLINQQLPCPGILLFVMMSEKPVWEWLFP